eukprot:12427347-Karenia_brevis.AAC.1
MGLPCLVDRRSWCTRAALSKIIFAGILLTRPCGMLCPSCRHGLLGAIRRLRTLFYQAGPSIELDVVLNR